MTEIITFDLLCRNIPRYLVQKAIYFYLNTYLIRNKKIQRAIFVAISAISHSKSFSLNPYRRTTYFVKIEKINPTYKYCSNFNVNLKSYASLKKQQSSANM